MTSALHLPAELTQHQASASLVALLAGIRASSGPTVELDAGNLQSFDSTTLAVLLACRREALAAGKRFAIRALPARLAELAGLYGVAELLPATA